MPKSVIVSGKTTAEAVEKGLKELNVSKDMVEIRTIEDGEKRSFYSILSPRVVKVELTVKEGFERKEVKKEIINSKLYHTKERRESNQNKEEVEKAGKNVEEFLNKFLPKEITYKVKIEKYEINVDIQGENVSYLIGYRGDTINALQTIISSVANKEVSSKIRVYLDVAGYREKREKILEDLANKIANNVIRTGKSVTLEPMTAYERKIIHSKLQEQDKVRTFSKGEEPYRKIVVALNDK
jgi:spoIIIJ-associated protein